MIDSLIMLAAEGDFWQPAAFKALGAGIALAAPALGLGMIGANYMKALGRNPEAGAKANAVVIIAAMVELTALLALVVFGVLL